MRPTKRTVLLGGLLGSAAAGMPAAAARTSRDLDAAAEDLKAYIGFGLKNAGGTGDNACGDWIAGHLASLGYTVERQSFDVSYQTPEAAQLFLGTASAPVMLLLPGVATMEMGLEGPLAIVPAEAAADAPLPHAAIAAIVLPHRRWSSIEHPLIQSALSTCYERGAAAALIVTTGPSGEAVALNVSHGAHYQKGPTAVIGPRDFASLLKAGRGNAIARLVLHGRIGARQAFNVVAAKKAGAAARIVVSTPRSGWTICAGERGPGVAVFLALARHLSQRNVATTLVCTSGHEFENRGGQRFLEERAPKPSEVALWVHLGANLAARDWHETARGLLPLPSADPQRFLMASPALLAAAQRAFAGLPGLETPYSLSAEAQGELKEIRAAGYARAIGAFGAHRYHHTMSDDERTVRAELIPPVTEAFRKFIAAVS